LNSLPGLARTVVTVRTVATQLYNYISVAGYSLGAWIPNVALTQHYYAAGLLNLVLLEGDPCWSHTGDGSAGLAQRAQELRLLPGGCLGADTYPYLTFANPFTAQSLCVNKDPICGEGYTAVTLPQQFTAAVNCGTGCSHLAYRKDGPRPTAGAGWPTTPSRSRSAPAPGERAATSLKAGGRRRFSYQERDGGPPPL
jgi:hypothetical protein